MSNSHRKSIFSQCQNQLEQGQQSFSVACECCNNSTQQQQYNDNIQSSQSIQKQSSTTFYSPQLSTRKQRSQLKQMNGFGLSPSMKNRLLTQPIETQSNFHLNPQIQSLSALSQENFQNKKLYRYGSFLSNSDQDNNHSNSNKNINTNKYKFNIDNNKILEFLQNKQKNEKEDSLHLPQIASPSPSKKVLHSITELDQANQTFFNELNKYTRKQYNSSSSTNNTEQKRQSIDNNNQDININKNNHEKNNNNIVLNVPQVIVISDKNIIEIIQPPSKINRPQSKTNSLKRGSLQIMQSNNTTSQFFQQNNKKRNSLTHLKQDYSLNLLSPQSSSRKLLQPLTGISQHQVHSHLSPNLHSHSFDLTDSPRKQSLSNQSTLNQLNNNHYHRGGSSSFKPNNVQGGNYFNFNNYNQGASNSKISSDSSLSSSEDSHDQDLTPSKQQNHSDCQKNIPKLEFNKLENKDNSILKSPNQKNVINGFYRRKTQSILESRLYLQTEMNNHDQENKYILKSDRSSLNNKECDDNSENKASLLRELYYKLNDMRNYVLEEINKDQILKQDIQQYYMIQDLNEFSFHFGSLLESLTDHKNQFNILQSNKIPELIFNKLTDLMHQYLNEQNENNQELSNLLNEQIKKQRQLIAPNNLLEKLGGYYKLKKMSEEFTQLLYQNNYINHLLLYPQDKTQQKIYQFLLAALHHDNQQTKNMIRQLIKENNSSFTSSEFYILKQIIYNYCNNHSYYSQEIKFAFFELVESYRYQLINEQEFNQTIIDNKKQQIIQELQFNWKQDQILSKLKSTEKNFNSFINILFEFTFSQKNCYELNQSFCDNFIVNELDILQVKSLRSIVLISTKKQGIDQQFIQMHFNYLFKKLYWFINQDYKKFILIIDEIPNLQEQLTELLTNHNNIISSSISVSSIKDINNNNNDNNQTENNINNRNKFKDIKREKSFPLNQQQQSSKKVQTSQLVSDTIHFSQFLSQFFNFHTTYHYIDLVCFYKNEKCLMEIFQTWISLLVEFMQDKLNINDKITQKIKKFLMQLFEFQSGITQ